MQDIQNIPNPDVDSPVRDDDFGSHPDTDEDRIPLPDDEPKPAPVEEPPNPENVKIGEDNDEPQRIL